MLGRFTCDCDPKLCMFLHSYCRAQACMQVGVFEVRDIASFKEGGDDVITI